MFRSHQNSISAPSEMSSKNHPDFSNGKGKGLHTGRNVLIALNAASSVALRQIQQ